MDDVLVRNTCSFERIEPRFLPLAEAAKTGMMACCGERVREIRLQGSIPRGDARVGHADLDMIALLDGPPTDRENRCLAELMTSLGAGTQAVSRLDLEAIDANTLAPFRRFVLSSDSLCLHGADSLTRPLQSMERRALTRLVTPDPAIMLPDYLQWVEELATADDAERRFASRTIGKDLLKVLRGVVLLRGAPYEVAIPRIAAQVRGVDPDATEAAARLFALYIDPTTNLDAIRLAVAEAAMIVKRHPEFAALHSARGDNPDSPGETSS